MTSAGEQVLLLTGLTEAQAPTDTVAAMLAVYGITDPTVTSYTQWTVLRAGADLLTRLAITASASPQLAAVEDISLTQPKAADLLALARSLRDQAQVLEDAAAEEGAWGVVEFSPYGTGHRGGIEAGDLI